MSAGYRSYTGTQPNSIREAANIQTDDGLVYLPPGHKVYGQGSATAPAPAPVMARLSPEVDAFWLQNNSGGADGVMGVGLRYKNASWIAGTWDDSETGTRFTIQPNLQKRTAVTISTATVTDGLVVGCSEPFGWMTWNVTTASVTNAVSVMNYWDINGAWVAPAATSVKTDSLTSVILATGVWAIGEHSYAWDPAQDWGKVGTKYNTAQGDAGLASPDASLPSGYYYMRIHTDGAPTVDPVLTGMEIGSHLLEENVDDEATVSRGPNLNFYSPLGDGVVMLNSLSGTANIAYQVSAKARG